MADITTPPTPISQQLADLARTGKPAEAVRLEEQLRRIQSDVQLTPKPLP